MKLPVKPKGDRDIIGDDNAFVCFANTTKDRDQIIKAINSHKKFKTYKTERENIFTLLNEKQLPILGGMCLDSIIRNLVKQFERRQSFIEEHDECEAYREYEVFCNEQEIEAEKKE